MVEQPKMNTELLVAAIQAETSGIITAETHVYLEELVQRLSEVNLTIADLAKPGRPLVQPIEASIPAWRRAEVDYWFDTLNVSRKS